ncbi:MAG: hypothetical protein KZQ87_06290 [Candidatus Thiodiazotropha sp. (ex Cardiolucina cf. quadrata)]|nr:hypothetical protein [Candidatus Thiodiazotropha sp. (ex Cardiolucina cf. quadrata)]
MKGHPSITFNHHPIPARFLGPVEGVVSTFETISPLCGPSSDAIPQKTVSLSLLSLSLQVSIISGDCPSTGGLLSSGSNWQKIQVWLLMNIDYTSAIEITLKKTAGV